MTEGRRRTVRELLRRWAPRALTAAAVLAALLLAVGGIADQLSGRSVLAATDKMSSQGPYANTPVAETSANNVYMSDIFSAELPSTILFKKSLSQGSPAQWNPYSAGGTPLGSITNNALLSPLSAPYYVLPTWLGPAYERLAEVICGLAGCFLFLRRLKLSPPAAILGGIVFSGSAFMIAWQGWPQTRVAAFIPLMFWATERFLQERRPRDVAILAVVTASLMLGGFPSVEGYACLTVGFYALARLLAEYRKDLKRLVKVGLGFTAGILAGIGLAMFQVLPFADFYKSWLIEGRGQTGSDHLDPATLVTAFAPWAFGGVGTNDGQQWILPQNPVESLSYIGAATLVLVLIATVLVRRGRALLPKGAWAFLIAATAVWMELIYRGGPPLSALQQLPVIRALFEPNFIGRARSVSGFLLACLAAVGFELVLHYRAESAPAGEKARRLRLWGRLTAVVFSAVVVAEGWHLIADGHGRAVASGTSMSATTTPASAVFNHEVLVGVALVVASVVCVAAIWFASTRRARSWKVVRLAAATAVLFLIAGQSTQFIAQYSPKAPKSTFYPMTDTQQYLAANLGEQRYASTSAGVVLGTDTAYGLRSLNGHTFLNSALATMVEGIPGDPVPSPTQVDFDDNPAQATSPILDRLGTAYFAAAPSEQVFGTVVHAPSDGTVQSLLPDTPVTIPVPTTGRLRAVGVTPSGTVPAAVAASDPDSWLDVVVHDSAGDQVAETRRLTSGMQTGTEFDVPVAADGVADGTVLTATMTLHASAAVAVDAQRGAIAVSAVEGADDGLKLVHAGSTVIYQRLNALPRIRWASTTVVDTDASDRVQTLASGSLPDSTVVLDAPGPAADGAGASVDVKDDGTDDITVGVAAQGAGYLVVADADQVGWSVRIDGKKADLVPADQGVVAVAVPSGTHTVAMYYSSPDGGLGAKISLGTAGALLAAVGAELWLGRRRRLAGVESRAERRAALPGGDIWRRLRARVVAGDSAHTDLPADGSAGASDSLSGVPGEPGADHKSGSGVGEAALHKSERSGAPPCG